MTRTPRAAAARDAASPAGPAPITARCGRSVAMARPLLRTDRVARSDRHQAGPLVGAVVDGHQAVEADADAAEDAAVAASRAAGDAPGGDARRPQRGGDGLPGQGRDLAAVQGEGERGARLGPDQLQGRPALLREAVGPERREVQVGRPARDGLRDQPPGAGGEADSRALVPAGGAAPTRDRGRSRAGGRACTAGSPDTSAGPVRRRGTGTVWSPRPPAPVRPAARTTGRSRPVHDSRRSGWAPPRCPPRRVRYPARPSRWPRRRRSPRHTPCAAPGAAVVRSPARSRVGQNGQEDARERGHFGTPGAGRVDDHRGVEVTTVGLARRVPPRPPCAAPRSPSAPSAAVLPRPVRGAPRRAPASPGCPGVVHGAREAGCQVGFQGVQLVGGDRHRRDAGRCCPAANVSSAVSPSGAATTTPPLASYSKASPSSSPRSAHRRPTAARGRVRARVPCRRRADRPHRRQRPPPGRGPPERRRGPPGPRTARRPRRPFRSRRPRHHRSVARSRQYYVTCFSRSASTAGTVHGARRMRKFTG